MSDEGIGRRRFLAWVGAGAAATAGGWAGLASLTRESNASAAVDDVFAPRTRGPEREVRSLHFALGDTDSFHTDLHLIVGGTRANLTRHDASTRRRLALSNPVAARTDTSRFTHFGKVNVPTSRPIEVVLWGTDRATGEEVILGGAIVHPTWATRRVVLAAHEVGALPALYAQHRMVSALGIAPEDAPSNPREALALEDLHDQATAIAQKIVFKHPSIISLDPATATITNGIILGTPVLDGLVSAVQTFLDNTRVYGQNVPMLNAAGGQQTLDRPGSPPGSGPPVTSFQPFATDGTVYRGVTIPTDWTSALRQTVASTVAAVINQVNDTVALEDKAWTQTKGTAPTTVPVTAPPPPGPVEPSPTTTTTPPPPPVPRYSLDNASWNGGTKMEIQAVATVQVTGDDGKTYDVPQITVRVYNNNEKVYDVYAQYLDADAALIDLKGGSVSATDLSYQLPGSLYAAPTIIGIPLFGQNYVDYVVTFPSAAVTVKLLLATMGGLSGWQQELKDTKGDQLYPGVVFPPQSKSPLIWTTVLNLALPTMMLALDIGALGSLISNAKNIAATATRAELQAEIATYFRLLRGSALLGAVARLFEGSMQSTDFGGPDKPSLVSVLVGLGVALIGLLSIPSLAPILAAVLTAAAVQEPEKAIPIVGEVMMAISVASDLALLVQTTVEIATEPWVLSPRKLVGQYDTTVTVQPDARSTAFPPGATKYTLTPHLYKGESLPAIVDAAFDPLKSDTLPIPVANVPLGSQIRYSITMTDANGWTVGAGSTDWLTNFDPTKLPVPTFRIRELAPPVSSGSSFTRRYTTQYDTAASGYSWSEAATVPGTIADQTTCDGPEDVCRAGSIAIGTATGHIGYTYQSESGWFVRQIGYPEPGTQALSVATAFAAEPLLHYDSISQNPVTGLNFLLQPIPGANAYHVRQLNLTAEGLGLDSTTSWGMFLDEIHGIVLHPAGLLVGFNTDSGKLHILELPDAGSDESLVKMATLHAGTGNASGARPGLTQRPVDVAVTLSGMVLVLEQAASRIQAFDARGNPTQYFTAGGTKDYYLPLDLQKTHLGLGVDGEGYLYNLNYSDDGTDPSQFGVDVYKPDGSFVFRGAGVNAASFVVDAWRNVFTQNFAPVLQTGGGVHLTAQGVAEPSTSVWVPDTPNPGGGG